MKPEIDPIFQVHILNDVGIQNAKGIAQAFDELLDYLKSLGLEGREFSIAKTNLETACFFAKKAMANNPLNQKGE